MIGESLLLLKGHSRRHMTCKALCPFQLKCISYKIEYKATVMVCFIIVLTVHKYEDSNVDFNLFLNCCKLDNCVMSLARPFHVCITVRGIHIWNGLASDITQLPNLQQFKKRLKSTLISSYL